MAQVKADGGMKEFLFNWGFKRKLYYLEEGRSYKHVRAGRPAATSCSMMIIRMRLQCLALASVQNSFGKIISYRSLSVVATPHPLLSVACTSDTFSTVYSAQLVKTTASLRSDLTRS